MYDINQLYFKLILIGASMWHSLNWSSKTVKTQNSDYMKYIKHEIAFVFK